MPTRIVLRVPSIVFAPKIFTFGNGDDGGRNSSTRKWINGKQNTISLSLFFIRSVRLSVIKWKRKIWNVMAFRRHIENSRFENTNNFQFQIMKKKRNGIYRKRKWNRINWHRYATKCSWNGIDVATFIVVDQMKIPQNYLIFTVKECRTQFRRWQNVMYIVYAHIRFQFCTNKWLMQFSGGSRTENLWHLFAFIAVRRGHYRTENTFAPKISNLLAAKFHCENNFQQTKYSRGGSARTTSCAMRTMPNEGGDSRLAAENTEERESCASVTLH